MSASRVFLAVVGTFVIMVVAPFPPYAAMSALTGLEPPGESPAQFMISVLVMKVGVSFGFVFIFVLARSSLSGRWLPYAAVWWLMYAIVEVGQAIGPGYSWPEALAGIIGEAVYFPLSALLVDWLLGIKEIPGSAS